jgi:hypothetical protein
LETSWGPRTARTAAGDSRSKINPDRSKNLRKRFGIYFSSSQAKRYK